MWDHHLLDWICENCNNRNDEDLVTCCACNHPRPQTESYAEIWIEDMESDTGTGVTSIR